MTIYKIYISLVQLFTKLNKNDINKYQALFWFGRPYNARKARAVLRHVTTDRRSSTFLRTGFGLACRLSEIPKFKL